MIEWQEHSLPAERNRLADAFDQAQTQLHAAMREEQVAQAKLARQRKPENIIRATKAVEEIHGRVIAAQRARDAATRTMCRVHLDIDLDDIVEVVDFQGNRLRAPILVEEVEFNREASGTFWLRIQGILLAESDNGRPQLRQGFDIYENDPASRLVKQS